MRARVIALQLRAWRDRCGGISQDQAADRLGVPRRDYKLWEDGAPCPFPALVENQIGVPVTDRAIMVRWRCAGRSR